MPPVQRDLDRLSAPAFDLKVDGILRAHLAALSGTREVGRELDRQGHIRVYLGIPRVAEATKPAHQAGVLLFAIAKQTPRV